MDLEAEHMSFGSMNYEQKKMFSKERKKLREAKEKFAFQCRLSYDPIKLVFQ